MAAFVWGLLVPRVSTITQWHNNGDDLGGGVVAVFTKLEHALVNIYTHVHVLIYPAAQKNLLLLSWLSSDRGEKNEPPSNLPAIIARTTSFSWAVCFKARGCSQLRSPHFLQTFYQSGSLAESHRIWPVSLRVTTTGRLSACERLPFPPRVPSSHLHASAFPQLHLQPSHFFTLTRGADKASMCFLKHL